MFTRHWSSPGNSSQNHQPYMSNLSFLFHKHWMFILYSQYSFRYGPLAENHSFVYIRLNNPNKNAMRIIYLSKFCLCLLFTMAYGKDPVTFFVCKEISIQIGSRFHCSEWNDIPTEPEVYFFLSVLTHLIIRDKWLVCCLREKRFILLKTE